MELLKIVGLENKVDDYPYNLSGGEQQRVAVARAFIGKTPILLADEPTGNLDETNSKIVMNLIEKLHRESGNTIVMITHDPETAQLADISYHLEQNSLKEKTT
jgi:putative ABC transport system ATP-binding protein